MRLLAPPRLLDIAFVKTPVWDEAEPETKEGFAELAEALGESCHEIPLPDIFNEWLKAQRTLMRAEMAYNLGPTTAAPGDRLSEPLRELLEEGLTMTAVDHLTALDWREALNNGLEQLFGRYDFIVTPAAPGEAPKGLGATGNPIFNGLWTLCGVPALTLPLLTGPNGLPVGVQVVARRGEDARLLRNARWLAKALGAVDLAGGAGQPGEATEQRRSA